MSHSVLVVIANHTRDKMIEWVSTNHPSVCTKHSFASDAIGLGDVLAQCCVLSHPGRWPSARKIRYARDMSITHRSVVSQAFIRHVMMCACTVQGMGFERLRQGSLPSLMAAIQTQVVT